MRQQIARSIARVILQIDGASSGRRKFSRRYFLPILSDQGFISRPNFPRATDRALGKLYFRSVYFPLAIARLIRF